ncbi:MAG: tyrosine-type recombinase/integrase [Pseudomonadota bacterium]
MNGNIQGSRSRGLDGRLWIKPPRTGKRTPAAIPCTQTLQAELESWSRTDAVILTTKTGLPWKARHFKGEWKKIADAAGIEDLHFHDLRGTAITMLSEAGRTPQQVASITGHSMKSISSILDRYLARTRVLAGEAIDLLENARRTKFANQMQTGDVSTERGRAK